MEVIALWASLGVYLALWTTTVVVEMRRVARRKGKKSMEQPYRYCRTYRCPGFHVVRRFGDTICQLCCLPLVEPSLEDLETMKLPEQDALDIAATMAHGDFNSRFGVPVPLDVAVYLLQLEQKYNVTVTATPSHASPLPVVQRQSTPPPALTSEDLDRAYADLSRMKADLNRMKYVLYMQSERGIFCSSSKEMHLP